MSYSLSIEEFIDMVQTELTIACSLPKQLPDSAIRLIIDRRALPFFYREYDSAVQKLYYKIDKEAFTVEEYTRYNYVNVPCEISAVTYLYEVKGHSLFKLGITEPNLSVNLGATNQPYMTSYVTTIGELGVYKAIMDSMSDMLTQFHKNTLKYSFNYLNNRLHILTNVKYDVIMEAYANIPQENLFKDDLFYRYVVGNAKVQLGNMFGRYDFTLPGSVKIQAADLISQGREEIKEVEEIVKGRPGNGFIIMKK